jgi:hypothetical protein
MFLGLKTLIAIIKKRNDGNDTDTDVLDKAIAACGYAYDLNQDMFYSIKDAWQRSMGYCRLYDETSAPTGIIVDCEPIYFEYNGKRWLIELWKGQYDLTTGCEIGVYTSNWRSLNIPSIYKNIFYHCANDEEMLQMHVSLIKNGKILCEREDKHWWLAIFKLGEFSEPSELIMNVHITLKDEDMRKAFVEGLMNAGYSAKEILIKENTVSLIFDKPRAPQPYTRTRITDWVIQRKNKYMCDKYQDIAKPINSLAEAIISIMVQAPDIYKKVKNTQGTKKYVKKYKK